MRKLFRSRFPEGGKHPVPVIRVVGHILRIPQRRFLFVGAAAPPQEQCFKSRAIAFREGFGGPAAEQRIGQQLRRELLVRQEIRLEQLLLEQPARHDSEPFLKQQFPPSLALSGS